MKVMIVGASGGIGRFLTEKFDKVENELILTYNSSESKIYNPVNAKFQIFKCDFSKEQEVINTFSNIKSIDLLLNIIGIVRNNLIEKMTENEWDQVIESNLKTIFLSSKHSVSKMAEYGHIINFSSILGVTGMIGATNYVAAKGAVDSFTKSFALECFHKNNKIFVNGIALGYFEIGMGLNLSEKIKKKVEMKIPLKKFGDPIEIYHLVNYITKSRYLVGQIIHLNGGLRI